MFKCRFNELTNVLEACKYSTHCKSISAEEALEMSLFLLHQVTKVEGIVYVIGNGGSAGIASHFSTDLLRTLEISSATFSDANLLTCFANDCGYENVFKMPLLRNLRARDLLVAISSSGKSANIIQAVRAAKEKKATVMSFSGFSFNNPLRSLGDLNFWLDSDDYGLVETGHFFLLHTIVDSCKKRLENLMTSTV